MVSLSLSLSLDTGRYSYYVCMKVIAYRIILVLRSTHIEKTTKCESVKENDYYDDDDDGGDWNKQQQQQELGKTHENSV